MLKDTAEKKSLMMCVFCGWSGLSDEARSNKPGGRPEAGGGHQGHQWHRLWHCAGHELHQGAGQLCLQFPCSVTCSVGVLCCVFLFSALFFVFHSSFCCLFCFLLPCMLLVLRTNPNEVKPFYWVWWSLISVFWKSVCSAVCIYIWEPCFLCVCCCFFQLQLQFGWFSQP